MLLPGVKDCLGVNDEANKIKVCSKLQVEITSFLKYVINNESYDCVSRKFYYFRSKTIEIWQIFQQSKVLTLHDEFHSSNTECVCQIQQLRQTELK